MTAKRERIPPGQAVRKDFPVLHIGEIPEFDPAAWKFSVWGDVDNPFDLTWKQFTELPRKTQQSDFHCVTGWSRLGDEWEGVASDYLVKLCRPRPEAKYMLVHASGGYTTNLTLEEFLAGDVLFALKFNGRDLAPEHGYPLRLFTPQIYAYKSAKWVTGFRLSMVEELGFWEGRGYHRRGDPWKEERYS